MSSSDSTKVIAYSICTVLGIAILAILGVQYCIPDSKPRQVNALTGPKDTEYMEHLPLHRCNTGDISHVIGVSFFMRREEPYYLVRIQKPDSKEVEVLPFKKKICEVVADLQEGQPIRVEHISQRYYKPGRGNDTEITRKVVIHVRSGWDIKSDYK